MSKNFGVIVKSNKGFFDVYLTSEKEIVVSKTRGVIRHQKIEPLVGDHVELSLEDTKYIITKILPRKNELIRPKVANIDSGIIIVSVMEPEFQHFLLDKYLSVLEYNDIEPIIILSKFDLLYGKEKEYFEKIRAYYEKIGYPVFITEQKELQDVERLHTLITGKTATVMGQTGVGKSTFLNSLSKQKLDLATNEISTALGRGRHTTRIVELYPLLDAWIADTPGFSSFDSAEMEPGDVTFTFVEFPQYRCQFHDCAHQNEKKCGVKDAVANGEIIPERLEHFVEVYQEVKSKYDVMKKRSNKK